MVILLDLPVYHTVRSKHNLCES